MHRRYFGRIAVLPVRVHKTGASRAAHVDWDALCGLNVVFSNVKHEASVVVMDLENTSRVNFVWSIRHAVLRVMSRCNDYAGWRNAHHLLGTDNVSEQVGRYDFDAGTAKTHCPMKGSRVPARNDFLQTMVACYWSQPL